MKAYRILAASLLIIPALYVLAFGPRGGREVEEGVVIVEYWEKWTGHEGEGIQATVNEFNQTVGKQKKIFVNLLSTSGIAQKTLVATAGGVPPDIAGLWDPNLAQLAALNALEPLDDLAAAHGITEKTYKKVFWNACHFKGKLYALVSTPYCYAMYYNKRIFRENADKLRAAGCDPDRPPVTIEELDRYAKALDEIAPDGSIKRTGYLPFEPGWDLSYIPCNFGGFWWDEKAQRFTFTDPRVIQAFTWAQSYSKRLGKGAVSEFRSAMGNYDSPQNPFLAGTTAIVSQGSFFANIIHNQRPSMNADWAAAPFPSASPEIPSPSYCTSDVLVIPKGAKHKKEAFEFIAWLNEQKNMEKLCNEHCKISPLAAVSDNFLKNHKNRYIHVFEKLADSAGAKPPPSIEILPAVADELANFYSDLAAMRCTPEEGLAIVQKRIEEKYEDFKTKQRLWEN